MRHSNINILLCLLISAVIHSCLILLVKGQNELASLELERFDDVSVEVVELSLPESANQRPERQAITERTSQQDDWIQRQPVVPPDRTEPSVPEKSAPAPASSHTPLSEQGPAPTPTPTPIRRQPHNSSSQRDPSGTKEAQTQQSAARASRPERPSGPDTQSDQARSNNVNNESSAGQQQPQQTVKNNTGQTNLPKPRRVVACVACPKPRYPKRALRRGIEGEPRILITINSDGRVQSVQLERSSGNPEIDRAALDAGRRSRFQAIEGGAKVPVSYSVVIKGSEKHKQAVQKQEKQRYTLPTKEVDGTNQSTTTNAD